MRLQAITSWRLWLYLPLSFLLLSCGSSSSCYGIECVKLEAREEVEKDCINNLGAYGYATKDISDWIQAAQMGIYMRPHPAVYCREYSEAAVR